MVWEYDPMECPQTIVRLYKGMMKAYVNQSSTYEGSTVVVEHQDKDQAAGVEVIRVVHLMQPPGFPHSHQEHRRLRAQG